MNCWRLRKWRTMTVRRRRTVPPQQQRHSPPHRCQALPPPCLRRDCKTAALGRPYISCSCHILMQTWVRSTVVLSWHSYHQFF